MVYTQGGLKFGIVGRHAVVQGNTLFQVCVPISFHFVCSLHTVRSSAPNEAFVHFLGQSLAEMVYTQGGLKFGIVG
jgi:hypothetical protein